jgi:hypothetical protein
MHALSINCLAALRPPDQCQSCRWMLAGTHPAGMGAGRDATGYGEAFYGFFHAHSLRILTLDEPRDVLQNLATQAGKPEVAASVAE